MPTSSALGAFPSKACTAWTLTADKEKPLANKAGQDDLVIWLGYREAKALLAVSDENR